MVLIKDLYLSAEELKILPDKTFMVAKGAQYRKMPQRDGEEVEKLVVPVKLKNDAVRDWIPNKTSLKKMVAKFGDNTDNWIGKTAKFALAKQNVRGEMKDIIFVE